MSTEYSSNQAHTGGQMTYVGVVPQSRELPVQDSLFKNGPEFDFFQAVSILESIYPERQKVGLIGRGDPVVRFAANSSSNSFAASSIFDIRPVSERNPVARMTVGFMGLSGPSGILPQHYTELLRRVEFEARGEQKYALRDWFDLFNDRMIALFYRSWKKYRPAATHLEALVGPNLDDFSSVLQCVAGLGLPSLGLQVQPFVHRKIDRKKLPQVRTDQSESALAAAEADADELTSSSVAMENERERGRANLGMLRYAGLLSQRPRSAVNLQHLLEDYFQMPFQVQQFHGNWLSLDETAQTRLGVLHGNSTLGENSVLGDQTWERQNKFLVKAGPVSQSQFAALLPDHQSDLAKNDFTLLKELIRLFTGPEMEFDIQVLVEGDDLPDPEVASDAASGLRLGWNTWLSGNERNDVASDAIFCVE